MQHTSTDSQQARTYDSFRLDGLMSPWHPHEAPQVQYMTLVLKCNTTLIYWANMSLIYSE